MCKCVTHTATVNLNSHFLRLLFVLLSLVWTNELAGYIHTNVSAYSTPDGPSSVLYRWYPAMSTETRLHNQSSLSYQIGSFLCVCHFLGGSHLPLILLLYSRTEYNIYSITVSIFIFSIILALNECPPVPYTNVHLRCHSIML